MNKNFIAYLCLGLCLGFILVGATSVIFAAAKKDKVSVLEVIGQVQGAGYAR